MHILEKRNFENIGLPSGVVLAWLEEVRRGWKQLLPWAWLLPFPNQISSWIRSVWSGVEGWGGPVKEIPLFQFVDLTMFLIVMCADWKWDRVSEYREVFTIACPDFDWLSSGFSSLLAPMICECAMRFPPFLVSVLLCRCVEEEQEYYVCVCRVLFSHVEWYNTQKEDEFNLFELLFTVISYAAAPPRWNTVALLNYCMHSRYYQWTYVQPVTFFGHLSCFKWSPSW